MNGPVPVMAPFPPVPYGLFVGSALSASPDLRAAGLLIAKVEIVWLSRNEEYGCLSLITTSDGVDAEPAEHGSVVVGVVGARESAREVVPAVVVVADGVRIKVGPVMELDAV